jgi:voltage-gated potassium channel
MALAVGSLPILLLEVERHRLPHADGVFIDIVNVVVLVAFAVDYIVELCAAARRGLYVRSEFLSLLIVVGQAFTLVPSLAAFGILRTLRAARLLRVVAIAIRAAAVGGTASRDGRAMIRKHAASFALGMATVTWLTSAAAFTIAEDVGVGGRVHSFFDALWWSLSTITTVGYGDIYPVTTAGRIIGGFTMIVGISTFALVTAKIAQFLVRSEAADVLTHQTSHRFSGHAGRFVTCRTHPARVSQTAGDSAARLHVLVDERVEARGLEVELQPGAVLVAGTDNDLDGGETTKL